MRIVPQGSSITGYIKETRLVKKTKKCSLWQEGTNREFLTKEPRPPPRVHRRKLFFRANTARKEMLSCTRCLIKTKEAKEGRAFFLGAREKKGRERKRRRRRKRTDTRKFRDRRGSERGEVWKLEVSVAIRRLGEILSRYRLSQSRGKFVFSVPGIKVSSRSNVCFEPRPSTKTWSKNRLPNDVCEGSFREMADGRS